MSERNKLPGLRPTEDPDDEIKATLQSLGMNEMADRIRAAIGAGSFDQVTIYAPPHRSRGDGREVTYMPLTVEEFEHLRTLPQEELERIGLRRWDDSGLMLLPGEWFPLVPKGLEVTDIFGVTKAFDPETEDDDCRFGVLSFGIILEGHSR